MQDSNTVTTTCAGGGAGREPVMDRTTMMLVSRSAMPPFSFPPSFLPPSAPTYYPVPRERIYTRRTLALLLFRHRIPACLCAAIAATPKFQSPGLHLELNRVSQKTLSFVSNIFFGYLITVDSEINVRCIAIMSCGADPDLIKLTEFMINRRDPFKDETTWL